MEKQKTHGKGVSKSLAILRDSIINDRVRSPRDITKFVFLCGANKSKSEISCRRKALLDFSKTHLPDSQFLLAEDVFRILQSEGHKENILDIENEISRFSDYILIVLESESAFAELGAFAHKDLRNKLIVINNHQFKDSDSFINLGPINAIREAAGAERIIHYKMKSSGVNELDQIADVFPHIHKLLSKPLQPKTSVVTHDSVNPSKSFDKTSVRFIHDLVYMLQPVTRYELIVALKTIFGEKAAYNKLTQHLGMLVAVKAIAMLELNPCESIRYYKSELSATYFEYAIDVNSLIAAYKIHYLRTDPERIREFARLHRS